jgi:hypothetical protein
MARLRERRDVCDRFRIIGGPQAIALLDGLELEAAE